MRKRWQADEENNATITAPLSRGAGGSQEEGERPGGIMLAKPRTDQQQVKAGGPGSSSQTPTGTHTTQPTQDTGDTTSI